jgi:glycosyltransferase involved in cell wall biosynthesis
MNSVDPNEFDSSYRSKGAAAGQPGGEFNIVYNGTVVKLLNLTMIVEALERLKQKMPAEDFERLLFRIYGDGPVVDNILSLAAELGVGEKVKYMGYLQPGEMRKEVLNSNVLILPPLKNIYSDMFYTIKLIEAIYLGIPVIATRLNTYLRYYGEGSLFYFDSGDVDDLCMRIEEVFYNRKLVEEKTKNAFNDYEKLNWSVMRERYIDIIRPLLQ